MSALTQRRPLDMVGSNTLDGSLIYTQFDLERLTDLIMDGESLENREDVKDVLQNIAERAAATLQWMDENDV